MDVYEKKWMYMKRMDAYKKKWMHMKEMDAYEKKWMHTKRNGSLKMYGYIFLIQLSV